MTYARGNGDRPRDKTHDFGYFMMATFVAWRTLLQGSPFLLFVCLRFPHSCHGTACSAKCTQPAGWAGPTASAGIYCQVQFSLLLFPMPTTDPRVWSSMRLLLGHTILSFSAIDGQSVFSPNREAQSIIIYELFLAWCWCKQGWCKNILSWKRTKITRYLCTP